MMNGFKVWDSDTHVEPSAEVTEKLKLAKPEKLAWGVNCAIWPPANSAKPLLALLTRVHW